MNQADKINSLIQQEKYTEALELLKPQLTDKQNEIDTRTLMSHCYYRLGHFQDSVDQLTQAIQLAPTKGQFYTDRGISFFMMNNRTATLKDFNQAQELEPQNPYRYSSRAYVKDAFGDTKGAIADYQKALELDPSDAISYNNLGLLLEKVGYQKEAQQHFAKADELEGRKPSTSIPTTPITKKETKTTKKASPPQQKQKISAVFYGNTLKRVFTTREGFREFLQYWFGGKSGR